MHKSMIKQINPNIVLFMEELYAHFIDKISINSRNRIFILKKYLDLAEKYNCLYESPFLNLEYSYLKTINLKNNF